MPLSIADLDNGKTDLDTIADFANSAELTVATRLGDVVPTRAGITAGVQDQLDAVLDEASGSIALQVTAAETAAANAAASYAAAQLLAAGTQVNEYQAVGGGTWTAPGVITRIFVDGRKYRMNNFTISNGGQSATPNFVVRADSLIDIDYV